MLKSRIILIAVLTTLLCLGSATIWRYGFENYYQYSLKKLDHIFSDSSSDDILLLGNSFTFYGIDPRPIDSATRMRSYNIAMGGAEIAEMKFLFESYLEHHPRPGYLVLQIHNTSLTESDLNNLLLYLFHKTASVPDELMNANDLEPLGFRRFVPFYPFFYMDDFNRTNSIKGLVGKDQGGEKAFFYKGFLEMNTYSTAIPGFFELDLLSLNKKSRDSAFSKGRTAIAEIGQICLDKNVKLIIVHPPLPFSSENNMYFSKEIQTQVVKSMPGKNYLLLDYSLDSSLHKPQYFIDNTHLNQIGSKLFSERLASDLKKIVDIKSKK